MPSDLASLDRLMPLRSKVDCCAVCGENQARWHHRDEGSAYCSLCLMYRTEWGSRNQTQVRLVTTQIELHRPALVRDVHSNLAICSEADDVLGVVVLAERTARVQR